MPRNLSRALGSALCCAALALSACNKPTPPDPERPPEPQATGVGDAIQAPLDKAKAVEGDLQQAADAQRAAIEAAGG